MEEKKIWAACDRTFFQVRHERLENAMLQCPQCRGRLPLVGVLKGDAIACPHCHSELEQRRGTTVLPFVVAIAVVIFSFVPLKKIGFSGPAGVLAGMAVSMAVWLPLYVLNVRYRLKSKPLSFRG
jgi:uncharacterized paraquat-inducible protein A